MIKINQKLGLLFLFTGLPGTGKTTLAKRVLKIPLVVSGGAGSIEQINNLFKKTNVSGVALSSFLHYNLIQGKKFSKKEFEEEGNIDFITSNKFNFKKFEKKPISSILKKLNAL